MRIIISYINDNKNSENKNNELNWNFAYVRLGCLKLVNFFVLLFVCVLRIKRLF